MASVNRRPVANARAMAICDDLRHARGPAFLCRMGCLGEWYGGA
jgi:hypothetical protein